MSPHKCKGCICELDYMYVIYVVPPMEYARAQPDAQNMPVPSSIVWMVSKLMKMMPWPGTTRPSLGMMPA